MRGFNYFKFYYKDNILFNIFKHYDINFWLTINI